MADQEDPERMEEITDGLEEWFHYYEYFDRPPEISRDDLRIIINCLRLNAREIRRKAKLIEEGK